MCRSVAIARARRWRVRWLTERRSSLANAISVRGPILPLAVALPFRQFWAAGPRTSAPDSAVSTAVGCKPVIACRSAFRPRLSEASEAFASPSWLSETPALRVLPGPDDSSAASEHFARLCDAQYRLASASDRTGYRLMADRPLPEAEAMLVSQPVVTGAIQLPPGGSPLLLMADRQTTGGYAIVAVVVAADLPLAGQLGPGDSCRFVPCEWEQARLAAMDRRRALDEIAPRVG